MNTEEAELQRAIQRVLDSRSPKKLVVAGPGTGKTTLFKALLQGTRGEPDSRLVLTFINNLRNDLESALSEYARTYTLHAYCLGLLHREPRLRGGLSPGFMCVPGLAHLIALDWQYIMKSAAPKFLGQMRNLDKAGEVEFYLGRGNYYDAVDFDDCVFRAYTQVAAGKAVLGSYEIVLIDEYQDFNRLEAGLIDLLARTSPILIAGDDDQALYAQLRDSSWDYIRALHGSGEYEVFELPFCLRCPKVIVDAVNDLIRQALRLRKLEGRIAKPYKHFPPAKGADSEKYPSIALVYTTVQREKANYMGRYIAEAISRIPREEFDAARSENYPAALVIAAEPYRRQITTFLVSQGYTVDTKRDAEEIPGRQHGLEILKKDERSNLGWRIVLACEPAPFAAPLVEATADMSKRLLDLLPADFKTRILAEAAALTLPVTAARPDKARDDAGGGPSVRVTSYEGAKGLSAQHVFIAGLHNGELPHNPDDIRDIEICRLVVGLTRTRKRCHLLHTGRFADKPKTPSCFLRWIARERYERLRVDADYWAREAAGRK